MHPGVELPAAVEHLAVMSGLRDYWDWDPDLEELPEGEAAEAPASQDMARSAPSQIVTTGADQDGESSCAGTHPAAL